MEGKTLLMMVGLPRSGKTSWALMSKHPIVNPDAIRIALHGHAYIPDAERLVWSMAHYMVKSLFLAGHDRVVLDACNNTEKRRDEWKSKHWERSYVVIKSSLEDCIDRVDKDDPNSDGLILAIMRMHEEHEPVSLSQTLLTIGN